MVEDRTIVVESAATGSSADPLDEGSLLVIRIQGEEPQKSQLVPLGKVFEVFGPVSRPLYTVRLPLVKEAKEKPEQLEKSKLIDTDEISLNDDDDSKEPKECEEGETTREAEKSAASNSETGSPSKPETSEQTNDDGIDPWTPKGKYTKLLQSAKEMPVYYIPDIAKLLDTGAVIRNSGRGCGELSLDLYVLLRIMFASSLTLLILQMHRIYTTKKSSMRTTWRLVTMNKSGSLRTETSVAKRAEERTTARAPMATDAPKQHSTVQATLVFMHHYNTPRIHLHNMRCQLRTNHSSIKWVLDLITISNNRIRIHNSFQFTRTAGCRDTPIHSSEQCRLLLHLSIHIQRIIMRTGNRPQEEHHRKSLQIQSTMISEFSRTCHVHGSQLACMTMPARIKPAQ
jgi:hypothetical protein